MSYPIVFRRVAWAEYDDSIQWYEDRSPGLGSKFETRVESLLDLIAEHRDRYPLIRRDIRQAPVHGFPYSAYYRVRSGRVVVVSVFHESRDPKEWQARS